MVSDTEKTACSYPVLATSFPLQLGKKKKIEKNPPAAECNLGILVGAKANSVKAAAIRSFALVSSKSH